MPLLASPCLLLVFSFRFFSLRPKKNVAPLKTCRRLAPKWERTHYYGVWENYGTNYSPVPLGGIAIPQTS